MKIVKLVIFLTIVVILSLNLVAYPRSTGNFFGQTPVSQSVIGRWQMVSTEKLDNGIPVTLYQLEFMNSDTLIFNRKTNDAVELYNIVFYYRFLEGKGDQISIRGRYADELQIERNGADLFISSNGSLIPDGRYKKVITIHWPLLGIVIGSISFLISIKSLIAIRNNKTEGFSYVPWKQSKSYWLNYFSRIIMVILLFAIGLFIGRSIWTDWIHLLIPIGWDGVIMLELSLALAILALSIIFNSLQKIKPRRDSVDSLRRSVGLILFGFSLYGIAHGAMMIIIFLTFGSYF